MPVELKTALSAAAIRVGTASWTEPEFVKAEWYPRGLDPKLRLPWYASHFNMVELNSSFYALPAERQCEKWVTETPEGFLFDVKCHRLLSRHATKADALPKDLREQVEFTDRENVILTPDLESEVARRLIEAVTPLQRAGKLGALLLQMTPAFAPRAADLTALEPLLRQLKGSGKDARKIVLELRHHGWLDGQHRDETTAFLRGEGVVLASIDGPPADAKHFTIMPAVDEITEPRLAHGQRLAQPQSGHSYRLNAPVKHATTHHTLRTIKSNITIHWSRAILIARIYTNTSDSYFWSISFHTVRNSTRNIVLVP